MPTFDVVSRAILAKCLTELDLVVSELFKNPSKQLLSLFLLQFYELVQLSAVCDVNNIGEEDELRDPQVKSSSIKKYLSSVDSGVSVELLNRVVNSLYSLRNSIGHKAYVVDKELSKFSDLIDDRDMSMVFNKIVDLWIPESSKAHKFLKSKLFIIILSDVLSDNDFGHSECYSLASKLLKVVDGRSEYTVGEAKFQLLRRGFAEGVVDKVLVELLYTHDVVA